jgi:hypothetical protein
MWWGQPKQATSAKMAIIYITVGALMDVWTVIYFIYLRRHNETDDTTFLWVEGFFATGVVLMLIGFGLGWIGRFAKQAEVSAPPPTINTGLGAMPAATVTQPVVAAVSTTPAAPAPPAPSISTPRPTSAPTR